VKIEIAAVQKSTAGSICTLRKTIEGNRTQRDDDSQALPGDQRADDTGSGGEQHALGEREPNESRAPCPESHANGELAPARPGAHEQQIGDVRARNEQERANSGEQNFDRSQLSRSRENPARASREPESNPPMRRAALETGAARMSAELATAFNSFVAGRRGDARGEAGRIRWTFPQSAPGATHPGEGTDSQSSARTDIGIVKPAGITPTIVYFVPSYSSTVPSTSRVHRRRSCHHR
jgi:hypothetical protein